MAQHLLAESVPLAHHVADHQLIGPGVALVLDGLVQRGVEGFALGAELGQATAHVKLMCSEMVGRVADRAVHIHGGAGLVRGGLPVERFYRDIRHYRVGEGASEIQRMLIARELLA